jgi:hypothetical protein
MVQRRLAAVLICACAALLRLDRPAFAITACAGAIEEYVIPPAATDPAITDPPQVHFVLIDRSLPLRPELLVWFPGSCAPPIPYRALLREAAANGYRVLGLSYPNCPEVNETCNAQQPIDPDCHEEMRTERLFGVDASPLITVTPANSIRNRVVRLLEYLEAAYPGDGWGQFLVAGEPLWSSIVVGGHSQGGGHAANVGREHEVARVAMFDWTDVLPGGQAAPWLSEPKDTPAARFFGIAHLHSFPAAVAVGWEALGLPSLVADVDATPEPYSGASRLTTDVLPSTGDYADAHGSVAVTVYTPLRADGTPLLSELWRYLFGATPPAVVSVQTTRLSFSDDITGGDASRRRMLFKAKTRNDAAEHRIVVPAVGSDGDPTIHGGVVQVFNAEVGVEVAKIVLPAAGWRLLGSPDAPRGFRFDGDEPDPAVRRVVLKSDSLTIEGRGPGFCYTLDEASQGRIGVRLTLGAAIEWCAEAPPKAIGNPPSTDSNDRIDRFTAAPRTPPPSACPMPPRPPAP